MRFNNQPHHQHQAPNQPAAPNPAPNQAPNQPQQPAQNANSHPSQASQPPPFSHTNFPGRSTHLGQPPNPFNNDFGFSFSSFNMPPMHPFGKINLIISI